MKFICGINMDNAAFEENPGAELSRILLRIAEQVASGHDGSICRDINDNRTGQWDIYE